MHIREATPDDAATISDLNDTVQAVHAEALPHIFKPPTPETFSTAEVRAILDDPQQHIYIAYVDDRPAGYIYVQIGERRESPIRRAMQLLYIHHISVNPEHQGTGVGKALIDHVKTVARENGIDHLELDVWSFNTHAQAFFQRQGFEPYNVRMWLDLPA
jgi:ribosomal protein S18 acetylase RimI-like enzyme